MTESDPRYLLFDAACVRAEWTAQQLWLGYLALGGTSDAFEIEAYLAGLTTLEVHQQDVLAVALNERLYDLYLADRVPYLFDGSTDIFLRQDPAADHPFGEGQLRAEG